MNSNAEQIVQQLTRAGFIAYYAGGCVRDLLLDRVPNDIDIVTNARPEQIQQTLPNVTDVHGKVFGVVRATQNGETFEVATFRKDGPYLDGRHPVDVTFSRPEEDAQRRDFTINGLFYDPLKKEIIDYVNGQEDLKQKKIRAIGNPNQRFAEDYLRIFRAIRFAAQLDFQIDPDTWSALISMADSTKNLSPERVRDELIKCFTSQNPQLALDLLDQSGLLQLWLPEVHQQKGVQQPPQFHPEGDVYTHARMMLGNLSNPSLTLAFSVLLHDIGKTPTYFVDSTGRIRFNNHENVGAEMAETLLRGLRFSNQQIEDITTAIRNHMSFKDTPNMRLSTLKRFLARPTIDDEIKLHRLDCLCSHGDLTCYNFITEKQKEFSQEQLKPEPFVTGQDILDLGIPSGPLVGKILTAIQDEQLEGKLTSREQTLQLLPSFIQQFNQ